MSERHLPEIRLSRAKIGVSDDEQHFTTSEVARALARLGRADVVRLQLSAATWSRKVGPALRDDLLNEAIRRAMDGRRRWSTTDDLFTFMSSVMRSIAHEWGRKARREAPIADEDLAVITPAIPATQESTAALGQIRDQTAHALADDPVASTMFTLKLTGATAHEIRVQLQLDEEGYETAFRRLKRKLLRLYPEGPPL